MYTPVENPDPNVCPDCRSSAAIYSVYRDGGSTLYCGICKTKQWPNPNFRLGKRPGR